MFDLARNGSGGAILVEPRDDENQILSQISAAFMAFYNDLVDQGNSYAQARQLTEDYYQEIVLTDVLPAYVGQDTINKYLSFAPDGQARVNTPNLPNANFTPIEFSVGAYRFGHSLVRQDYHINDIDPTTSDIDDNVAIFDVNTSNPVTCPAAARSPGPASPADRRAPPRPSAPSPTRPATKSSGNTSCPASTPSRMIRASTSPARRKRPSAPRCSTSPPRRSRGAPTPFPRYATARAT
ncbi:MAG: hypothetical protein JOZ95_09610 [Solirubrobacterales bacterium]|nr:hypothetical protein [Solirubrobacterales bacterium]